VHPSVAPGPDDEALEPIHEAPAARAVLPAEHLVDAGCPDADALGSCQQGIDLVEPVTTHRHWQQRADESGDVASVALDREQRMARCPSGQQRCTWSPTHDPRGNAIITIRDPRAVCARCTRSERGPRELTVRPQAQHQALQAARKRCRTTGLNERYAARAGIEGAWSAGVRVSDLRRSRDGGRASTYLQHVLRAAAINLRRFGAWAMAVPHAPTRRPAVVTLMAHAA
jgi:transposase